MAFDIEGARKAGYSDAEIADHLGEQSKFDVAGARKAGYSDAEILSHLTASAPQAKEQGFGERLDATIKDVPYQLGLAARYGIEGPSQALGVLAEPIRQGINAIPGVHIETPSAQAGALIADKLGLPSPRNATERVVGDASRMLSGAAAFGGIAGVGERLTAGVADSAVANQSFRAAASNPAAQAVSAASAGVAGGATRETGGGPMAQFVASLAGGLAGGLTASGLQSGLDALVARSREAKIPPKDAMAYVDQMLEGSGVKVSDMSKSARDSLVKEVRSALATGKSVNEAVVRRLADYGAVGATPTRGAVSLDPVAITQEKNLAKIGANSQDPRLQILAQRESQNNAALVRGVNDLGASEAASPVAAGERISDALRRIDAPRKAAVDAAYQSVRDAEGRYANLNTYEFSRMANSALDEQQLGSVLPDRARSLLNDVSSGKIPLNVNTSIQIDKRLSGMMRDASATGDKEGALAIRQIRDALNNTPVELAAGKEAMDLYGRARQMAAQRFASIEKNPAMAAALDDAAPDKFVQSYLVGSGSKANLRDVSQLARELKQDPEAYQAARQQIAAYLKGKALNGAADEVGNFSASGYNKALEGIGIEKLKQFFTADEIGKFRAIGRVASYEMVQPKGSAVGNSNTAAHAAGLLERIAGSPLVRSIPLGKAVAAEPAGAIAARMRAKQALAPLDAIIYQEEKSGAALPYLTLPGIAGAISNSP